MANPLQGACFISRSSLTEMVRDSYRRDRELKERLCNAVSEYKKRTESIADYNRRVLIFKEIAAKYGFREQWFITKVRI